MASLCRSAVAVSVIDEMATSPNSDETALVPVLVLATVPSVAPLASNASMLRLQAAYYKCAPSFAAKAGALSAALASERQS